MKRHKVLWTIMASLGLVLAMAGGFIRLSGHAQAQGPALQQGAVLQTALGSGFTYQGRLVYNGQPVNNDTCSIIFSLWDATIGGSQIGSDRYVVVHPQDGYFTAEVDFGSGVFTGDERYLQLQVDCAGDSDPGTGTVLPRVRLAGTPYALGLQPGAHIEGSLDSGAALWGDNDSSGIGVKATSWSGTGLYASSFSGAAARFENLGGEPTVIITNTAGTTAPLLVTGLGGSYFEAQSSADGATAITGDASATSGQTHGVTGATRSNSAGASGVFGWSMGASGQTYGVFGQTSSNSGNASGVKGISYSGATNGVWGETTSSGNAAGVYGLASATEGTAVGVWGRTYARNGIGGKIENRGSEGLGLWVGSVLQTNKNRLIEAHETDANGNSVNRRFLVEIDGDVFADGTFHSGGADFAELFPAADGLEPGDVLVIGHDGRLTRSIRAYQPAVAGVYSTKPSLVGGAMDDTDWTGKVPLAVVGIVPVKASTENGPIRPGDLLVASSTPGHAMHSGPNPPAGTIIGKALEGLEKGTGVIRMLVMLR